MWLKTAHIACAALTAASFLLRGFWMLWESPLLQRRLTRILPHVVDAILLMTGLAMAVLHHGAFYRETWLMAKLAALAAYVGLGMLALRRGRSKRIRTSAFLAALAVFTYIVLVARTRSAIPF